MEPKPRRGRPPKSPDEQRSEMFTIRVTKEELAEIEATAEGKPSAWAREVLLRAVKRRKK